MTFLCQGNPLERELPAPQPEPRWQFVSDDGHDDYALDATEAEQILGLYLEAGSPFTVTRFWVEP